ncbi:MAG TPA: hypothetical protein VMI54_29200 [Polyangiaceae bacterium]|nr:hypothetical protein [Polyangiaceae bacterium]
MLTSRTILRSCLVALSFAGPLAFVAPARADVACGDQTCPQNYTCQSEPVACPAIACAKDDPNCTPVSCTGTVQTCEPLPCTSDSDCADGMVCYTQTEEVCPTAPACAKGQDCPQATDTTCTTSTMSGCVPKYLLPCNVDADCGDGFTCEEEQECGCAGSASSSSSGAGSAGTPAPAPAADGGAGDPTPASNPDEPADAGAPMDAGTTPPPDCSCQPNGTKACNLKTVACNADSDCPSGFTCGDNPNGTCFADANGNSGCSADPAMICLPPWAHLVSTSNFAKDASAPGSTSTGLGSGSSGSGSASSGSGSTSSGSSVPPTASSAEGSAANTPAQSNTASDDGGGCSIGRAPRQLGASFGFAALAALGLAAARRRRR